MDSLIAQRYRVLRRAGRGGMGIVYHAEDLVGGGEVALKVIAVSSPAERRRVAREASVLASMDHPGIVRYLDHGTLPDGDAFLAMEWLGGETLDDRLGAGELGLRDALGLGIRLAEALGHAHRIGIVHRDLKPSNVLLGKTGLADAKLIDFGIARGAAPSQIVTQAGMIVGTPGYMAPEQARGERDLDARADVFALGCLLYRCLAGRPAFTGKDAVDMLLRAARGATGRVSDVRSGVPTPVDDAIAAMLAADRSERPNHGAAAASLLRLALESAPEDGGSQLSLTGAEQRLVSVVAATPRDPDPWLDATVVQGQADDGAGRLASAMRELALELEILPDRTFIVAVTGADVATDLAAHGASVARVLRQIDPSLRIAVATGLAMHKDGHTQGRAVDVATAALSGNTARPVPRGEIWLDEVTATLLDGRAALDTTESGYRLRREGADTGPRRLGMQMPFHGRDRELQFLEATFEEVQDERAPRAVIVTGEAGIGKSRLVEEALSRASARGTGPLCVLSGRGDPSGRSSPFALVAEAVRRAADLYQDEPESEQLDKLRARVALRVPAARVEEVTQKLALMIGLSRAPASQGGAASGGESLHKGDLMRRAFEDFVAAEAAHGPVVVILEDLQWGDLPSLLAVDGLMRRLAEQPLWVVAVGRPEIAQTFPGMWAHRSPATLSLGELGRRPAERLVRAALGESASDEAVMNILERGGGSPLFLEQLVRGAQSGAATMPETVLAIVALRLEHLSAPARRTLRAASIFGLATWTGALRALLGAEVDSPALREALEELSNGGLLERRPRSRFAGEDELAFTNAAVRDVAYDTLTSLDRTTGHRLAAEWLEQHGENDAVRLAEQWDRASERLRAAALFGRAAEQALEGADFERCVQLAQLARERETDPERRCHWLAIEAEALGWAGRFDEMNERAAEALEGLRPGSTDWCRAGAALMLLGGSTVPMDRLLRVVGSVAFMPLGGEASQAEIRIHAIVGMLLYRVGQLAMADGVRDRVLALVPSGESEAVVRGWMDMVRIYEARFARRTPHETYALAMRAAAAFEAAYDLRSQSFALVDAGYGALALGRFTEAVQLAERGSQLARSLGIGFVHTYGGAVAVAGLSRAGCLAEARALASAIMDESASRNDRINCGFVAHMLAVGELEAGHVANAAELARQALQEPGLPPTTSGYARATLARCELAEGRTSSALTLAREARATQENVAVPDLAESWIAVALVEALEASGDEEAEKERQRSAERVRDRAASMPPRDAESFLGLRENVALLRSA